MVAGIGIGEASKGKDCREEQPDSSTHIGGIFGGRKESTIVSKGNGDGRGRAMQGKIKIARWRKSWRNLQLSVGQIEIWERRDHLVGATACTEYRHSKMELESKKSQP